MLNDSLTVEIDPRNTCGWPKNRRQLEWAKLHVLDGHSVREAALRAGYAKTTAKAKSFTLQQRLWPFLVHLQIRKNEAAEEQLHVNVKQVLARIAAIAFSNHADYVEPVTLRGNLEGIVGKPLDQLSEQARIAVKRWTIEVVETEQGTVLDYRYELEDKFQGLLALGKHLGMFNDRMILQRFEERQEKRSLDWSIVPTELIEEYMSVAKRVRDYSLVDHKKTSPIGQL